MLSYSQLEQECTEGMLKESVSIYINSVYAEIYVCVCTQASLLSLLKFPLIRQSWQLLEEAEEPY